MQKQNHNHNQNQNQKQIQKLLDRTKETFAHVYKRREVLPLSRFRRNKLIYDEMRRYKPNMDMKSRRPHRLKVACAVVVVSMIIFVLYRIIHMAVAIADPFMFSLGIYGMLVAYIIVQQFICSYFFYRDPYVKASTNPRVRTEHPKVSVVIATKNERFVIFDAVYSCLNCKYKNLEVCIVNDGSDDNGVTAGNINELVKANPGRVKAKHLATNEGKRKAMRHGVHMATGEIIVFLDSDTIADEDGISRLVACLVDDPDLGCLVGYCRALNSDENWLTKMQDTWYHSAFTISKEMEHVLGTVSCCSGILSAYRKEAILPCIDLWAHDKFLGCDPFIAGDDRQLTAYVIGGNKYKIDPNLKQWRSGYCECALSISETPGRLMKFIMQQVRWMQSWTRVMCFTFGWYYKDRNPLLVIDYYLRMGLSYLAPVIAINNLVVAPLTGHWDSTVIYILGLTCLSFLFAMDFRLYNPQSGKKWIYRIGFTFLSVTCLYFLLYYSVYTLRSNKWLTR
jgi:hyaluronan synthase